MINTDPIGAGQQLEPAQPQPNPTTGARLRIAGQFIADPAQAERDAQAASLRGRAMSYRQIAAELGVDVHTAHDMVQRATAAVKREAGEVALAFEVEKLDRAERDCVELETAARQVLTNRHVTVSNGKIVRLDGKPLDDDGPVLNAVDTLRRLHETRLRIAERRAKLLGLDAAQKIDTTAQVKFVVEGVPVDEV